MATRRKPHDPARAAQAALERKARDEEAARMESQGATVKRDRAGHIISAYRSNVFNLLLSRGTITQSHHDAAARLADDWRQWKGLDGRPELPMEFVNGSGELNEAETGFTSAKRRAAGGFRVAWVLGELDPLHAMILCKFMVATVEEDRPMHWRGLMESVGIRVRERQTLLIVGALEELRAVFHEPRERAA